MKPTTLQFKNWRYTGPLQERAVPAL